MNNGPSNSRPLDQLADVHLPEPVSAFPWAPGWWVLLAAVLTGLVATGLFLRRRYRRRRYRRQALSELRVIAKRFRQPDDDAQTLQQLNQLMRRVAMTSYPRDRISGLTTEQWAEFLRSRPGAESCFDAAEAHLLAEGAYRPDARIDEATALFDHCAQWLRRHRSAGNV